MEQANVLPLDAQFKQISALRECLNTRILGQEILIDRMLIALLAGGHLLVEGAPGLAKTKAIKELAAGIEGNFHRIQFTPDLLPGDLTGTDVYRPEDGSFVFQPGPLFHNLILADEINRAPAKVQSALLEAMAERQITIGQNTYALPELYLVMATQNPIEQEGTYPLPEAQLDRFLMYVRIDYPHDDVERSIVQLAREELQNPTQTVTSPVSVSQETIATVRKHVVDLHLSEALEDYFIQLVMATRHPEKYHKELARWIRYGASPRASIALDRCSRVHAWLHRRDYVTPEDIHAVAYDVLRHRVLLTFEAEAEGVTTDQVIDLLLKQVAIP